MIERMIVVHAFAGADIEPEFMVSMPGWFTPNYSMYKNWRYASLAGRWDVWMQRQPDGRILVGKMRDSNGYLLDAGMEIEQIVQLMAAWRLDDGLPK